MNITTWSKVLSLIVIDIVTLCGNFALLLVGYRSKSLRTFQNAFIYNMAFSDFLQGLLIVPSAMINSYRGTWPFGKYPCYLFAMLKVTFTLSSVYSLSGLSVIRYFYIVKKTPYMNTMKSTIFCIAISWIVSIFLSVTPLFGWGRLGYEDGKEVCTVYFHESSSHTVTVFSTALFLNVFIMTYCYIRIFCKLRGSVTVLHKQKELKLPKLLMISGIIIKAKDQQQQQNHIQQHQHPQQHQFEHSFTSDSPATITEENHVGQLYASVKKKTMSTRTQSMIFPQSVRNFTVKELKLLKTIFIIIVVFICCWTPYVLFNIIRTFGAVGNMNAVDTVTMWLGFINSAANPVMYGALNKQFRKGMKKILCHVRCKQNILEKKYSVN